MPASDSAITIGVLGGTVALVPLEPGLAAPIADAWRDALTPAHPPAEPGATITLAHGPGPHGDVRVAGADARTALWALNRAVSTHLTQSRTSSLLLLHAAAMADPDTGAGVVLVGGAPDERTAAVRALGDHLALVAHELVGVAEDGTLPHYLSPMPAADGTPTAPGDLGHSPARGVTHAAALVVLDHDVRHAGPPSVARLDALDTLTALARHAVSVRPGPRRDDRPDHPGQRHGHARLRRRVRGAHQQPGDRALRGRDRASRRRSPHTRTNTTGTSIKHIARVLVESFGAPLPPMDAASVVGEHVDLEAARRALLDAGAIASQGYTSPGSGWPRRHLLWSGHELSLQWPSVTIDLHWHLSPVRGSHPDFEMLWARRSTVDLYGHPVATLKAYDALAHSASHAAKDHWRWLRSLVDVHRLASNPATWAAANRPLRPDERLSVGLAALTLGPPAAAPPIVDECTAAARAVWGEFLRRQCGAADLTPLDRVPGAATIRAVRAVRRAGGTPTDLARLFSTVVFPPAP